MCGYRYYELAPMGTAWSLCAKTFWYVRIMKDYIQLLLLLFFIILLGISVIFAVFNFELFDIKAGLVLGT